MNKTMKCPNKDIRPLFAIVNKTMDTLDDIIESATEDNNPKNVKFFVDLFFNYGDTLEIAVRGISEYHSLRALPWLYNDESNRYTKHYLMVRDNLIDRIKRLSSISEGYNKAVLNVANKYSKKK